VTGSTPAPVPVIVGAPRSGTTLLRMMLDAHPDLAIPPETHFLPALARLDGHAPSLRARFVEVLEAQVRWRDLGIDGETLRAELATAEHFDPTVGVRTIYRLYAQRQGKPRWGDKTPDYSAWMPEIERLLPEARFVHVLRDGRDVVLSLRDSWFAPSSLEVAAYEWHKRVITARRAAPAVGHYMEVRYEDLVREPRAQLERVCRFVELPFHESMLAYHETAPQRLDEVGPVVGPDGSVLASKEQRLAAHRRLATPPDRSRTARWRAEMRPLEIARVERTTAGLLDALRYQAALRGAKGVAARTLVSAFALHPRLVAHRWAQLRHRLGKTRAGRLVIARRRR
jgi:hypothetical protein